MLPVLTQWTLTLKKGCAESAKTIFAVIRWKCKTEKYKRDGEQSFVSLLQFFSKKSRISTKPSPLSFFFAHYTVGLHRIMSDQPSSDWNVNNSLVISSPSTKPRPGPDLFFFQHKNFMFEQTGSYPCTSWPYRTHMLSHKEADIRGLLDRHKGWR